MGTVLRALLRLPSADRQRYYERIFAAAGVSTTLGGPDDPSADLLIYDVPLGRHGWLEAELGARTSHKPALVVAESYAEVALILRRSGAAYCPYAIPDDLSAALHAFATPKSPAEFENELDFGPAHLEIIEQIAMGRRLSETLERIVRLAEAGTEGGLCTVLLLGDDRRVLLGAAPNVPAAFANAYVGRPIGPEEGSCGAAMALAVPVLVSDIASHPNWVKYRDAALAAGLRSCWSVPIFSADGAVLGAFALYYREPREPSASEFAWVRRASHLAAIAVMRERAERALRVSEARYRQIVDTAYEGVWLVDAQAHTSFVNARTAHLLGYSAEEMLGKSLFDFMDASERADAERQMLRRFQKISEQHEFKFRRKDGSVLWAIVAASPLLDERGNAVGALGMLTDITRLKRAEATLNDNELELRTIFDNAALGIALVDEAGRTRRSNPAFQKMLGYSGEELAQMSYTEFTHADDIEPDVEAYRRLLNGEVSSYQREKRFVHRSGAVVWGRLTASVVRTEAGIQLGIGLVEDITAHKLAQARIAAQAFLLDNAKDAILVRSFEGVVEYWNRGAERLYGWSSEEALGRNVADFLYAEPSALAKAQQRLLADGSWNGELLQQTQSGQAVMVECRWTLTREANGSPAKVLCINSDVTEKKRLEAQVIATQRMESLGTLAGGIAHDLNNILAAIVANVSLALEDVGQDHPARLALSEINDASLRAAALVRQILTFSRPRPPERRVIHLELVVAEALRLLRATLPASIRIESTLSPTTPAVLADATQVHQVVMNLATNAAHALRERGGVLCVHCEGVFVESPRALTLGELRAGPYTRLVVEDNGAGMSERTLARIFDPFFTTKPPGEGTGLGLSVVHGVMRGHEGGIEVRSAQGRGSRFDLYFPAVKDATEPLSVPDPSCARGGGERILCVDDEASILRATKVLLERLGYAVVTHTEPDRALAELEVEGAHFDAIVTDSVMPILWGVDFVRKLLERQPDVPIVMMSGLLEPDLETSLRELGVREFVSKPATIEELGAALRRVLSARAARPA